MGRAYGNNPDTFQYPWEVSVKNRYSKRLVAVEYHDTEKSAREAMALWRNSGSSSKPDNIIKLRKLHNGGSWGLHG